MSIPTDWRSSLRTVRALGAVVASALVASCDPTAPGLHAHLQFAGQPSDAVSMTSLGVVSVGFRNKENALVPGEPGIVAIALVGNPSGRLFGETIVDLTNGGATFSGLTVDKAGAYHLVARFVGGSEIVDSAVSNSFQITPGPASRLTFSGLVVGDTSAAVPAGPTLGPVRVEITDVGGNRIASASASITLALSPDASLYGTTTVATTQGAATFDDLSIHKAATFHMVASAAGLDSAASGLFKIGAGSITHLAFEQQPADGVAGSNLGVIYVDEVDAYGNVRGPALDLSDQCTISIANNPTGATLSGHTASLYANGFNYQDLSIDKAGSGYTLRAHHTQYGDVVSAAFNIAQ
jgi:hypothetical protein